MQIKKSRTNRFEFGEDLDHILTTLEMYSTKPRTIGHIGDQSTLAVLSPPTEVPPFKVVFGKLVYVITNNPYNEDKLVTVGILFSKFHVELYEDFFFSPHIDGARKVWTTLASRGYITSPLPGDF
jgi:hypothetical protein